MTIKRNKPLFMAIDGTSGPDTLFGTPDPDVINGFEGNDTLIGGGGADTLIGGLGDDDYRAEEPGDLIFENVGEGFDRVYAVFGYTLPAGAEIELLSAIDPETESTSPSGPRILAGNEFAQTIIGAIGAERIYAGGGGDVLAGGRGGDHYRIEDARDVIIEGLNEPPVGPATGSFADQAHVGLAVGSWTLTAGSQVELITAIDTNSTLPLNLAGNEFNQAINGTRGNNVLIGGGGRDAMTGYGGNDDYRVEDSQTFISDSSGFDRVYATVSYTVGNAASIELLSTIDPAATTQIDLGSNSGACTLIGNAGVNRLTGGGGADDFAFVSALGAGNVDVITDMVSGTDRIVLEDAIFTNTPGGPLAAGAFVNGTAAQDVDDRIIYNQSTGALFFDADGSGAGAAIQFATLENKPIIAATDFYVF